MVRVNARSRHRPAGRVCPFELSSLGWMRLAGMALMLIVLTGWMFPRARLWGVHALAFQHPVVSVGLFLMAALMLTPLGGRIVALTCRVTARWRLPRGVWIALALLGFVLLRVQEPLFGDGQALLRHLETIGRLDARRLPWVDIGQGRWAEPLETFLHETVFRVAVTFHPPVSADFSPEQDELEVHAERTWFFETGRWTYILLSATAGALLILLLLRFAKRMLPESARAVFLLGVFGTGAMLTFFGYVEDYAWTSLAVAGCVLSALEDMAMPRWPWRTLIWWATALAMHVMTIFLLPLIVYVLLVRHVSVIRDARYGKPTIRIALILFALAVVFVSILFGFAPPPIRRYVLPLTGVAPYQGYPLLSLGHAIDLVNLLLLVVPVIALAGASALSPRDDPKHDLRVLQLASAGGIGFLLLFDPALGASRDWDLCSVALWPMIVAGVWLLAKHEWGTRRDALLASLAAGMLLIPVPLVLVHANTESEVARLRAVLIHDPARSAYGWENLGAYYRRVHDYDHAIEALQHAVAVDVNPHYKLNLATELRRGGRLEEAEPIYFAAAQMRPDYVKHLLLLAQSYARRGDSGKVAEVVRRINELEPGNPIYARLLSQLDSIAATSQSVQN